MSCSSGLKLNFHSDTVFARFIDPKGNIAEKPVEIRTNPVTLRTCRISRSRAEEKESGVDRFPEPPPDAGKATICPFCKPRLDRLTPRLMPDLYPDGRIIYGGSVLFPNLYPYGAYSAVSLIEGNHFVEIGTARFETYRDSLINSCRYLRKIIERDPRAVHMAITQNHLPSAGGSLVHPHLQVHADRPPSNNHRLLFRRADEHYQRHGTGIYADYLKHEISTGARYIGKTGDWHWMTAFAPEGFYELWSILPGKTSFFSVTDGQWSDLALGIVNAQRFYRSLNRNGYNLGILTVETPESHLEIRASMLVRSNYAPWIRNDHTGYEVMLGDMATFEPPESYAEKARSFWTTREETDS